MILHIMYDFIQLIESKSLAYRQLLLHFQLFILLISVRNKIALETRNKSRYHFYEKSTKKLGVVREESERHLLHYYF